MRYPTTLLSNHRLPIDYLQYSQIFQLVSLIAPHLGSARHLPKKYDRMLTNLSPALPPNPPQIPRRRRPRHRPPYCPRSPFSRLHPRQSLLLHLPNSLLRPPPHDGLCAASNAGPLPQHPRPSPLRHRPRKARIRPRARLPNLLLVPRWLAPSLCRPFHRRALRLREAACQGKGSCDECPRPGDIFVLWSVERVDV